MRNNRVDDRSRAQRCSDAVAHFCGSWGFVIACVSLTTVWISAQHFDPYPFILFNLVLTVVSTLQGPLIMMAQNREAERDRKYVQEILERIDSLEKRVVEKL